MVYEEDDLLPISAIQHLAFCPRQAALIHLERVWEENQLTAEGHLLHERAHDQGRALREDVLTVRSLRLRSLELGLIGLADVVEFHRSRKGKPSGVVLPGRKGLWAPRPVEYKRGRRKADPIDELQLCCQALCLEEMLGTNVTEGQIFYGAERRRSDVVFTVDLRVRAREMAATLHRLVNGGTTPDPSYGPKCRSCSLADECLPRVMGTARKVEAYLSATFRDGNAGAGDT